MARALSGKDKPHPQQTKDDVSVAEPQPTDKGNSLCLHQAGRNRRSAPAAAPTRAKASHAHDKVNTLPVVALWGAEMALPSHLR